MRTCLMLVCLLAPSHLPAQDKTKGKLNPFGSSERKVYKKVGDVSLHMRIYNPPGHKDSDKRPAIVFFFGGGWRSGTPRQFMQHSRYLASRGMVAMTAEYRVYSRHKVKVAECVADALSAIRWVRAHASKLGVDPRRIASAGGSAGGHLAAAVATLNGFDESGEDTAVSARPNAMLLFNPALDLRPEAFNIAATSKRYKELSQRFGSTAEKLSPTTEVKKGIPPTIIFHGKGDKTVPFAQAEAFAKAMKGAGNRCEIDGYEGQGHGFFNYGRGGNKAFIATVKKADAFLSSLEYLKGECTIEAFLKK